MKLEHGEVICSKEMSDDFSRLGLRLRDISNWFLNNSKEDGMVSIEEWRHMAEELRDEGEYFYDMNEFFSDLLEGMVKQSKEQRNVRYN